MKCKCGVFIGSGRLSDTCGQCKTNHESSNKDCLLILEQSERIKELELAVKIFCSFYKTSDASFEPLYYEDWINDAYIEFKQLLEKGK